MPETLGTVEETPTWERRSDSDTDLRRSYSAVNAQKAIYMKLTRNSLDSALSEPIEASETAAEIPCGSNVRDYIRNYVLELKRLVADVYPGTDRKLRHLSLLPSDWDGAGAEPVSDRTMDLAYSTLWTLRQMAEESGVLLPEPDVGPGVSGTVQFEWKIGSRAFELELIAEDNAARYEYLICPTPDDADWDEGEFRGSLGSSEVIETFLSWLRR